MAGLKLHEPYCTCWYCRFEDNWFYYLPISYRIYDRIMRQARSYLYERTLKMKTHRTCGECKNGELIDFVCTKKDIAVCIDDCCKDFVPKNSVVSSLEAAAKKCAATGDRRDLQAYLKLRREML